MSGAGGGRATGVIATLTVNSYTALPIRIRTRRLVGGGMTTTFVSMTHDLTLGTNRESENRFASVPAYVASNCMTITRNDTSAAPRGAALIRISSRPLPKPPRCREIRLLTATSAAALTAMATLAFTVGLQYFHVACGPT